MTLFSLQKNLANRFFSHCVVQKFQTKVSINLFLKIFLELYGAKLQLFNFHTTRNLCERVRRSGPLRLFCAFCFESANNDLLSAVQGTTKEPEAKVEDFVNHQASIITVTAIPPKSI